MASQSPSMIHNPMTATILHPSSFKPKRPFSIRVLPKTRQELGMMVRGYLGKQLEISIREPSPPFLVSHSSVNTGIHLLSTSPAIRPSIEKTRRRDRNHTLIIQRFTHDSRPAIQPTVGRPILSVINTIKVTQKQPSSSKTLRLTTQGVPKSPFSRIVTRTIYSKESLWGTRSREHQQRNDVL